MIAGLCDTCAHRAEIRSDRGSVFSMCRRGLRDPAYPKYPRLPVLRCSGFETTAELCPNRAGPKKTTVPDR
jgi:hypothetical protein